MSLQRIDRSEVIDRAVGILGLDESSIDLFSVEGVCASLRRAASFLCPASPRQIVDSVLDVLAPLSPDLGRDVLNEAIDVLVGAGDLLELRMDGGRRRQLYLGPPSYVQKRPGQFLLLGVRPNAAPIVDEELLGAAVTYEAHTRYALLDPEGAAEALSAAGLHRLTRDQWAHAPRQEASSAVVEDVHQRLTSSRAPGQISGLMLIDPAKSVRYYKGRWREPIPSDQGMFVGRRPQAYGAPIWCAVELESGVPQAVLDLPINSTVNPGWDDARRLQAALDAQRGGAQVSIVRAVAQPDGNYIFDFFGPLPSWAERYLDLTGLPVARSKGALFSYRLTEGAKRDVQEFLSKSLWMRVIEKVQGP